MSVRTWLARAFATVAAVGVTVAGPAGIAGAADTTPNVNVPVVGIDVRLGSTPVITIGSAPAGTSAPGVTATVPVDLHAAATVGSVRLPSAPVPPAVAPTLAPLAAPAAPLLASATGPEGRLVDADVALHACVAAALLGGRAPDGCGVPAGTPAPSLADALARVGVCARAAVLADAPVTPCGTTPAAGNASIPASLAALDADTQVCAAATVLGLADPARCPGAVNGAGTGVGTNGNGSGTRADNSTVEGVAANGDICLGLAVLTSTATTACPTGGATSVPTGAVPTGTGDLPTGVAGLEAGSGNGAGSHGEGSGGLPFTGGDTMLLTLAGLGSVAAGFLVRRGARAFALR